MKKKLFLTSIIIVVCIAIAFGFIWVSRVDAPSRDSNFAEVAIGSEVFHVELAKTQSEQMQGLSSRDEIGSDGMLFLFSQNQSATFWMKDMRFSLDMVWILDTIIVGIDRDVLPPTDGREIQTRKSPGVISAVLEVPAGVAVNMIVGQTVSISY